MQLKRAKQDEIQAIEGRNTVVKPTFTKSHPGAQRNPPYDNAGRGLK